MANEDQSFLADPISYIFGGNTGLSYGDLQQRRAIAMALARREKGFPKNKGEGMTYLGDSIAEGLQSIGLARAERARQASLKEQAKMFLPPPATPPGSTARPVRTAPQPAPSTTAPAAMPQIAGADPALASTGFAPGANLGSYDSSTDQPVSMITPAARAAPPPPPPPPSPPAPVTAPTAAPEPTAAPRASLDLGPEEQLVPDDEATSVAERAPPSSPTPSLPPEATAALRSGMLRDNIAKAMLSPQFQANQPQPNVGPVTSQEGNRIAMSADTTYPGGDSAPPARVAYSGPRSSPPPQGWAATDPRWQALDDNQKAAAMAMMEANPNDDQGRIDVLAAIHNRADKEKVTVGSAVSRHTYQPTMEPSQQARLDRILADPAHAELTAVSQGYANGEPRPHTATHFLAPEKTMLALEAKNPGKYHSWRDWTGYDPQSGQYSGVQLRDNSHAFLSPDGPPPQAPSTPVRMLNVAQQANPLDPSVAVAAADQEPPQQQQAQAEPPDTQDARLAQVVGGGLPGLRARGATASLGRAGVVSDAPPIGNAGGIGANDPGIAQSVEARRNAIANTLMQNGVPAPEVPQPDPTQAGTSPSPTTASASGASPLQLAQAGGTLTDSSMFDPRAFSGRPLDHGIAKAPPPAAAPAATAAPQAPAAPPAGQWYDRSQPKPPDPPKQMGRTDDEVKAMRWKMMNPGDPDVAAIADAIIKTEADKRTFHDTREIERYKGELSLYNTEYTKWQDEQVSRPKRIQDYVKANQGIIAGAPTAPPAARQPDPRIGTPQSPQRSGVPTAPPVPPGTTPEQWATLQGPELQKAQEAVEKAVPQFNDAIGLLRQARDHPGKEWGTGVTSSIAKNIPGTDAYAFGKIMEQIGGKNFLQAYSQLKGGGAISNIEGTKAEAAQARLATAQGPKDFDKALADFEIALRRDFELAQRKVNQPVTAWRAPGDNASYAPDIGERRGNNEYIGGNPNDPMSWKRLR